MRAPHKSPFEGGGAEGAGGCHGFRGAIRVAAPAVILVVLASCARDAPPRPYDPAKATPSVWPMAKPHQIVTSRYGYRKDPRRFRWKTRFHSGIDISAPKGTTVFATGDGVVLQADRKWGGWGRHITIDHQNGFATFYAHLSDIDVKPRQKVLQGQPIGKAGKSGRATGCHLHYEVRKNGKTVDPAPYLKEQP